MDAGPQIHRDVDLLGAIRRHLYRYFHLARILDERLPLYRLHLPSTPRLVALEKHNHTLHHRNLDAPALKSAPLLAQSAPRQLSALKSQVSSLSPQLSALSPQVSYQ